MTPQEREYVLANPFKLPGLATQIEEQVGKAIRKTGQKNFLPPSQTRKWFQKEQKMRRADAVAAKAKRIDTALEALGEEFTAAEFAKTAGYTRNSASVSVNLNRLLEAGRLEREFRQVNGTKGYVYWRAA